MNSTRGLLSSTGILTIGLLAQGIARFLYTVVIGRFTGPEALGEVNTVLSLAVYLSLFWPAALGVTGSRYIPTSARGGEIRNAMLTHLKRSFWVSSALSVPVGFSLATALTESVSTGVIAGALIGSYGAYTFVRGTLLGENRVVRVTVVDSVSSFAALTLLLMVVSFDATPLLLLPLTAAYLTFSALGWPRSARSAVERSVRRQLNRFTRTSTLWLVASGGLLPATMLFVQAFSSPVEAGVFAAAITLATPANMLAQAFSQVLLPHIAGRSEGHTDIKRLFNRLFTATILGFTLVFGSLAFLTPWLLEFFYGDQYSAGAQPMYWLLLGVFLSSSSTVPISTLMGTGRERSVSLVSVVSVVLGTATMASLAPLFGTAGILAGYVGAVAISFVSLTAIATARPSVRRGTVLATEKEASS